MTNNTIYTQCALVVFGISCGLTILTVGFYFLKYIKIVEKISQIYPTYSKTMKSLTTLGFANTFITLATESFTYIFKTGRTSQCTEAKRQVVNNIKDNTSCSDEDYDITHREEYQDKSYERVRNLNYLIINYISIVPILIFQSIDYNDYIQSLQSIVND